VVSHKRHSHHSSIIGGSKESKLNSIFLKKGRRKRGKELMGANFHNHSSKSTKLCDSKIAEAVRKLKKMIKKKKSGRRDGNGKMGLKVMGWTMENPFPKKKRLEVGYWLILYSTS